MEYRINSGAWLPVPEEFENGQPKWTAENLAWVEYNDSNISLEVSGGKITAHQILQVDLKKDGVVNRVFVDFRLAPTLKATKIEAINEPTT